ncbi:MAG TPA: ABC transporter permease, partial [Herpetosiphonaceae bacterium]
MQKIWTIIRHEYWQHLRRKGFLFSTFGMPLVFLGLMALIALLSYTSNQVAAIGYVDQIGLFHAVPPELEFSGTPMRRFDDLDSAAAAVRERRVDVAFVIPPDYLERGQIDALALEVVPSLAEPRFERFLQAGLALRLSKAEPSERVVEPIARLDSLVLDAPPEEAAGSVF